MKKEVLSIDISEADNQLILKTIQRDIQFLEFQNLMDYSLLIGIEKVAKDKEPVVTDIEEPADEGSGKPSTAKGSSDRSMSMKINGSFQRESYLANNLLSVQKHSNGYLESLPRISTFKPDEEKDNILYKTS